MLKEVEKIDLNQSYFLIQKNIDTDWVNRGKFSSEKEAMDEIERKINEDIKNNNKFTYRIIKIDEIKLFKSKEKKPEDMLEFF
jgi:hypothetical protein